MDVMQPKLEWVEGRCYRFFESDAWSSKDHASTPYIEDSNPEEFCDLNEDSCPVELDIVSIDGGKYKHSFYVPKVFHRFMIGQRGIMHSKLENETKTSIQIPKVGADGDIVIIGSRKTSVLSARHRIDLLVENSKKKLAYTHFLSIPMTDKNIAQNNGEFKNKVLNETGKGARGVHEGIFQKAEKMHLTLGLMVLLDDKEIKAAIDALEECREKIILPIVRKHGPLIITAQGLECFNDDPSEVSVIFGKVTTDNDVLQQLAEKTVDFFVEKGLMKREHDKINLHLTVMNVSFMIDREQSRRQSVEKFDATNILKVHKDYYFGETMLNRIQLCQRGAKAEDGYYVIKYMRIIFPVETCKEVLQHRMYCRPMATIELYFYENFQFCFCHCSFNMYCTENFAPSCSSYNYSASKSPAVTAALCLVDAGAIKRHLSHA